MKIKTKSRGKPNGRGGSKGLGSSLFSVRQTLKGKTSSQSRDLAKSEPNNTGSSRPERQGSKAGRKFRTKRNDESKSTGSYQRGQRLGRQENHRDWLEGVVKRHPDGFGFFIPDEVGLPDVYIPRHEMSGVMSNDRLRVRIEKERGGNRLRGELVKILERSLKRVSGAYESVREGMGLLRDHSLAWGVDLIVSNPERIAVEDGDFVVAEVLTYPDSAKGFTGKLIAVVGDPMNPLNDSMRALHRHHIPFEFTARTIKECEGIPDRVTESDRQGRQDLTKTRFITIDGKTAKDFDDAIFVERDGRGFKLKVAIADVSHYVKPMTNLDDEAYQRGTSTYFPGFVAPMLPEELSNEICSLKPNVERLAFVAEMKISAEGELNRASFFEAVIQSHARVTYGEAQDIIDGQVIKRLSHVEKDIHLAAELARILMERRFESGSLDLEIPETEVELDDTGEPVDILQSERLFAHRLIEEMMLMANVAVARELKRHQISCLNRVHEEPSPDAIAALSAFMESLGSHYRLVGGGLQKKITAALEEFKDHPQKHILNVLTLRSMAQARYSAEDLGHFGLGFKDYAHFTSPIRRYPDLITHRQLKAALGIGSGYQLASSEDIESAGTFLSACEQRSVKAERFIKAIKKARFMSRRLGEEFEGMVSSVAKFGVFVVLRQFDIDGLIRIEELGQDRFEFNEEQMMLVGRRSGQMIRVGDMMRVLVAAANIDEGRIDFLPAQKRGQGAHHSRKI